MLITALRIPESERSAWRPSQLTAAAFPSLVRIVVVVLETVSREDSRKEGRVENGIEPSRGT